MKAKTKNIITHVNKIVIKHNQSVVVIIILYSRIGPEHIVRRVNYVNYVNLLYCGNHEDFRSLFLPLVEIHLMTLF